MGVATLSYSYIFTGCGWVGFALGRSCLLVVNKELSGWRHGQGSSQIHPLAPQAEVVAPKGFGGLSVRAIAYDLDKSRPDNPTQPSHTTSADLAGTPRSGVDSEYEWLNGRSTLSQFGAGLPVMAAP